MQVCRDKIEADNRYIDFRTAYLVWIHLVGGIFLDSSPSVLFGCKSSNCKTESYENIQTIFPLKSCYAKRSDEPQELKTCSAKASTFL